MGALGCFHFHLTARDSGGQHGALSPSTLACHAGAAVCCAVACLSNAVGAVVPLLIVAWDLLVLPRPKLWKIVGGTAPLWAVSLVTIVIKGQTGSDEPIMPPAYSIGRVMLIMNVYWLNLKTLAWPANLSLFYDWLYPESFLDRDVLLGGRRYRCHLRHAMAAPPTEDGPVRAALVWVGPRARRPSHASPHSTEPTASCTCPWRGSRWRSQ